MVSNPFVAANEHYYLSKKGFNALKNKLHALRGQRIEQIQSLKALKEQEADSISGENSSYVQAVANIQFIEIEIEKLEHVLAHAKFLDDQYTSDEVTLGSNVKLKGNGQEFEYTIVQSIEADPSKGKISDKSPLGKQLLGKKLRDYITLKNIRHKKHLSLRLIGIK